MPREAAILQMIHDCLRQAADELAGYRVLLFGSRATGRAKARSDFDLGVIGAAPLPLAVFYRIADQLENLPTLYTIDWVDLSRVSREFRARALAEGRVLHE